MRSRSTITAAFALAAATILAISACGSSVGGSAAVNAAAAQTLTSTTTSSTSTSRTSTSSTRTTTADSTTDGTTSHGSTPATDLTDLTDLTALTDLSGLTGYSGACINVSLTYLAATVAPFATLAGGSTPYDGSDLQKQLDSLKTESDIPTEIAPDLQAIEEVTSQANGASLSDAGALFSSDKFTTASDHISKWLTANCGG
jgi:hypothetical protein